MPGGSRPGGGTIGPARHRCARCRWPALALVALLTAALPLHAQKVDSGTPWPVPPEVDANQPARLPPLLKGMTLEMLRQGDSLFHGRAGCFACHGTEGQGLPSAGPAITARLVYAQVDWARIDSVITMGIPNSVSAAPIAMPPRGARSDLTDGEIRRIAAYVWAISQARGEPWPGGHRSHQDMVPVGATQGTATEAVPPGVSP